MRVAQDAIAASSEGVSSRGSPLELAQITVAMSLVVGLCHLVLGLQPPLAPRDVSLSRRAVLGAASAAVDTDL